MAGKKLAILGYAFKANTNDTRETPAKTIAEDLIEEGAFVAIHDPKVEIKNIENQEKEKRKKENIQKNL